MKPYEYTCNMMRQTFRRLPEDVQRELLDNLIDIHAGVEIEVTPPEGGEAESRMGTAIAREATDDEKK